MIQYIMLYNTILYNNNFLTFFIYIYIKRFSHKQNEYYVKFILKTKDRHS